MCRTYHVSTATSAQAAARLNPAKSALLIILGVYTVIKLQQYGLDIAEKFYFGVSKSVRAEFTSDLQPDSEHFSQNTMQKNQQWRREKGFRWDTALFRLDKLVVLPVDTLLMLCEG